MFSPNLNNNMTKKLFLLLTILPLLPVVEGAAQDMAYPVEGDGIYSFLRRWNRVDSTYVSEFIHMNRERINEQGGLELGTVYLIPPLHPGDVYPPPERRNEPTDKNIFGAKYKHFARTSNRLKGACFYIISGHGGPDPGAIAKVNGKELHEHEYAYDVSLRLARNLMQEGATVYVIIQDAHDGIRDEMYLKNGNQETCMGEPIPKNQLDRLQQRVDKVNELFAKDKHKFAYARAIEIHVDSRNKGKRVDVFFYHAKDAHSHLLASAIRDVFRQKYDRHQPGRGFQGTVAHRGLYILRKLQPPSILVELGNIQNPFDRRRVMNSNNRQALANWMKDGIIKDYSRSSKQNEH